MRCLEPFIILYELLYGRTPWNSKQEIEQDLFENNVLKKPLTVKETTKKLIKNMLQIDQDKRFDFEQVLAQLAPKTKKQDKMKKIPLLNISKWKIVSLTKAKKKSMK